jgi:hypothetical protein
MSWEIPYRVNRLINMVLRWSFDGDRLEQLDDSKTGEPFVFRALRRVKDVLKKRREDRPADYDPIFDDELAEFHINDIAILTARLNELLRLEERLIQAIGPPSRASHFNKRTGKFEDFGPADDYGE